jgi:hypothetical protein
MGEAYIVVFINNGINLAHFLIQTDANEAEMKKKVKIYDSAPSYRALF